jgi:hypothetical protein
MIAIVIAISIWAAVRLHGTAWGTPAIVVAVATFWILGIIHNHGFPMTMSGAARRRAAIGVAAVVNVGLLVFSFTAT